MSQGHSRHGFDQCDYSDVAPWYFNAMTEAKNLGINKRFITGNPSQLRLITNLMIGQARAEDSVLIYSCSILEKYCRDAIRFCAARRIRIIVDNPEGVDFILNEPRCNRQSEIEVRVLDRGAPLRHFFVAGHAFRVELIGDYASAANFSEKDDELSVLKTMFDQMWANSSHLLLIEPDHRAIAPR